jgi:hypothetical protein
VADDATRQHVHTVADARAHAVHRRRRHADLLEVGQTGDTRAVLAHAGVVQDHRVDAGACAEIGGNDAAMRTRDQHIAGDTVQLGDAFRGHD